MKKKKITYLSEESGDELKKIKDKLKECQKEKEEYLTQAQRARADLINHKRRQEEMKDNLADSLEANIVRDFLPILDSLKAGAKKDKGIEQVLNQFQQELIKKGLEEIKSLGQKFNPEIHEAIEEIESKEEPGIIVEVVQDGYRINNLILRPSKVKISK